MKPNGYTLVEIMVVIAIIATVLAIAVPNFMDMKGKADTEKQTRELQSTINTIRLNAMQNKQRSALMMGPKQFIYKTYTSDSENLAAGRTINTFSYPYEVKRKTGSSTLNTLDITTDWFEFDSRGFTNTSTTTLVVTPVTYGGGPNCIVVQTARTSIGRMEDASTCQKQ